MSATYFQKSCYRKIGKLFFFSFLFFFSQQYLFLWTDLISCVFCPISRPLGSILCWFFSHVTPFPYFFRNTIYVYPNLDIWSLGRPIRHVNAKKKLYLHFCNFSGELILCSNFFCFSLFFRSYFCHKIVNMLFFNLELNLKCVFLIVFSVKGAYFDIFFLAKFHLSGKH